MNSGPTPPHSDDEARDPLLTALQQRLHDYAQAPPPGAWAAIRQQLPPAIPRPWWRQSRRLLPLLGLLFGLLAVSTLVIRSGYLQRNSPALGRSKTTLQGNLKEFPATPNSASQSKQRLIEADKQVVAITSTPSASSSAPSPEAATGAAPTSETSQATTRAATTTYNPGTNLGGTRAATSTKAVSTTAAHAPGSSRHPPITAPSLTARSSATQRTQHQRAANLATNGAQQTERRARRRTQRRSLGAGWPQKSMLATTSANIPDYPSTSQHFKSKTSQRSAGRALVTLSPSGRRRRRRMGTTSPARVAQTKQEQLTAEYPIAGKLPATGERLSVPDSLTLRPVALGLAPALLSPTLVARPDSFQHMPRARRWSVLVLAGPTLSYRTLGPAPTLAAQHPDFARLERPALGFGTQVQVRRVLSGRWALALGLGYHEYATRLSLSIIDSSNRSPRSVHQRDVYRVLTLPVQVSYALGAPHGRLAWALFLGAEPSWYRGGRSTEGSDCGCQQLSYPLDSARIGPYRSLSLALSLGLDLRYHLGGPASRWQWVVQPTARYMATPFVRSEAVGFTQRRPWSLGLLTGISWEFH
jgi:hypothetical protein